MTTYAIGDVRGCFDPLTRLLDHIRFDRSRDSLWFTGNLIGSGGEALEILRFVKNLDNRAVTVLGEAELRLLAMAEGVEAPNTEDKFDEILAAPDRDDLLKWISRRPLLHHADGFTLVHAGVPPGWTLSQARTFAIEAESSLSMGNRNTFFENVASHEPGRWNPKLRGWKRIRFIVNAFTRMRYCDDVGRLDFGAGSDSGECPDGYLPWYSVPNRAMTGQPTLFGHVPVPDDLPLTGLFPLDTGCARGGSLTALKLGPEQERFSVS